ncbi:CYFA0S02e03048g1_1 [Cyberlindnera fabianii]|uniref:CYFA0S02e03048g1_1 n=1 Tax=Cyberlindnera fabianii TaxID=36022 RepID=A0A061AV14_CYBFA|nr:CYFA0S02e03048g1_1 [Cyberlindnera fabianii]
MSDLEDDLLALAGGVDSGDESDGYDPSKTDTSPRKKRKVVDDDDEDDDVYNDVDEDDDEEDDYDPTALDDADEDEDGFEEENPYPLEGKYKDERDRAELESMPEVERESILFERGQEIQKYEERKKLALRRMQQEKQKERTASRSQKVRESAKSVKSSKLTELKKQRAKKSRRDKDDYSSEEEEEEEEEDPYDLGDESDGYEPDFQGYDDHEVQWAERPKKKAVELSDINTVKTGRSVAEKYCFYPGFKNAVVGTFGKVRVSETQYRMVRLDDVVRGKPYRLNAEKLTTDLYFKLYQPGQPRKIYPMNQLSDEPITPMEWDKWKEYVERARNEGKPAALPTVSELEQKYTELKKFSRQKLDGELFVEYMKRRQRFNASSNDSDVVGKKLKLQQMLDVAEQSGDQSRAREIKKQLNDVERKFKKIALSHTGSSVTAEISERNRKVNNERIRQAELKNADRKRTHAVSNADPFARLTTRARMYYSEANKEETEKAKANAVKDAAANAEKEEREHMLLQQAKYRSIGHFDKIISKIQFSFDLEA